MGPYSDTTKLTHGGERKAKPSQVRSGQVNSCHFKSSHVQKIKVVTSQFV